MTKLEVADPQKTKPLVYLAADLQYATPRKPWTRRSRMICLLACSAPSVAAHADEEPSYIAQCDDREQCGVPRQAAAARGKTKLR